MEVNEHLMPALREAIELLDQHGYRYAVIGGISLSQWGYSRYTLDVDIKVLVPNTEYATARGRYTRSFPRTGTHAYSSKSPHRFSYNPRRDCRFSADPAGYEEQIIERAVTRDLGGCPSRSAPRRI